MDFQYSDGGRQTNGFINEKLDCTVRAYALVMDITYKKSHRIFKQFGRKDQHTCRLSDFMQKYHPTIEHYHPNRPRPQVKTVMRKKVLKNAIVRINGHCFCVKNNIVLDMGDCQNCIVTDIWYFN